MDQDNLALDFLNTRAYVRGQVSDRISTPARLREWLDDVGLSPHGIDVEMSPPTARLLFDEAHRLRQAIHAAVDDHVRGEPPAPRGLYALNRFLESSRFTAQLVYDGERLRVVQRDTSATPLSTLSPIAFAAATLLTSVDRRRIRQCRADRCLFWFLDTSKNRRRRWCSMATCGNRAKAARHYQKQKAGANAP